MPEAVPCRRGAASPPLKTARSPTNEGPAKETVGSTGEGGEGLGKNNVCFTYIIYGFKE